MSRSPAHSPVRVGFVREEQNVPAVPLSGELTAQSTGLQLVTVAPGEASQALIAHAYDVLVFRDDLPGNSLCTLLQMANGTPVLVIGATEDAARAAELLEAGAWDVIPVAEVTGPRLTLAVRRCLALQRQIERNVERRVRAELDSGRIAQRFCEMFEYAPVGIALAALDGRFTFVNESCARMIGFSRDELVQPDWTFQRLTGAGAAGPAQDELRKLLTGEIPALHIDVKLLRKDGSSAWVRVGATVLGRQPAEFPLQIVAVVEDISGTLRVGEALQESEERLRLALEAGELGTWGYDPQSGAVYADLRCRSLFGCPDYVAEDFAGVLEYVHPEDRERMAERVNNALQVGSDNFYELEYRVVWPDGSVHWLAARGQCYFEGEGEARRPVRMIGTVMDISRRKADEELIRKHSEELEQLVAARTAEVRKLERDQAQHEQQAAVGRMAARIAHEINNPLAGVKNALVLVKRAVPADHPHFDFVLRIERELERIARIVRQMFELYRPEVRKPHRFTPADALRDVVMLLEGNAQKRGVTFEVDSRAAGVSVMAFEDSLRQVLFTLLQNALEASPEGSTVRVRIALEGGMISLTVEDRGSGIPPEVRPRIFEPFFTTKRQLRSGGLGLGLAVTRSLIEGCGGRIWFESEAGQGTKFHVTLPVGAARDAA